MQDYLYDGTFEGFLTCVYHHYYTEQAAGICLKAEYQSSLLGGFQEVHTGSWKSWSGLPGDPEKDFLYGSAEDL